MSNKKEELLLTQELLETQQRYAKQQELTASQSKQKAILMREEVALSRSLADMAGQELAFHNEKRNSLRSLGDLLGAQSKQKEIANKLEKDFLRHASTFKIGMGKKEMATHAAKSTSLVKEIKLSKTIGSEIESQIKQRITLNKKLKVGQAIFDGMTKIPFVGKFLDANKAMKAMEKTTIKTGSGLRGLAKGMGSMMKSLASSGPLIILTAIVKIIQFIVSLAFELDKNMTKVQTTTGLSEKASKKMFWNMHNTAEASGKVWMQSQKIVDSYIELVESTGLVAGFNQDFLYTMSMLKDRLGMSSKESQKLTFFTKLQGKDGEKVLNQQIGIVNQYNKQNKTAFSGKMILKDIANTSNTVAVALGMGTKELTKGALAASRLGLSMDKIWNAAGGFLDFQSSIQKELEFSLATNQEVSFAKERQMALNNDLVGLAESLRNKEEVLLAFRTGNRIQMDLAAAAMNMTTEDMSQMIMRQEYLNMAEQEYLDMYGEQSLLSMQEMDAQEAIAESMAKMRDRLLEMGEQILPMIESFATWIEQLATSKGFLNDIKFVMNSMLIVMGALAARSITMAIANAWAVAMNPTNPANMASLGAVGLVAGGLATGIILSSTESAPSLPPIEREKKEDDFIFSEKHGVTSFNKDDLIIGGTNLMGGKGEGGNSEDVIKELKVMQRILLEQKDLQVTTKYDSFAASDNNASGGISSTNTRYKSSFV